MEPLKSSLAEEMQAAHMTMIKLIFIYGSCWITDCWNFSCEELVWWRKKVKFFYIKEVTSFSLEFVTNFLFLKLVCFPWYSIWDNSQKITPFTAFYANCLENIRHRLACYFTEAEQFGVDYELLMFKYLAGLSPRRYNQEFLGLIETCAILMYFLLHPVSRHEVQNSRIDEQETCRNYLDYSPIIKVC